MSNLTRIASVLLIAILVIVVAVPVPQTSFAQGGDCPSALTGEDCELFNASSSAMFDAGTFSIEEYTLTFQVRADGETTALNTTGSGVVEFSDTNLLQLALTFDPATSTSAAGNESGGGAILLNNDGVWLGTGAEGDAPDNLEWAGLLFDGGMQSLGGLDDLGETLGDIGADAEGVDFSFVQTTRGEDIEFNGETVAVFNTDVNAAQFLRSSLVSELLNGLATVLLADAEIDPSLATVLIATLVDTFASDLEENSTIRMTQYISTETTYVTYVELDIDLNIDLSLIAGFIEDVPASGLGLVLNMGATLSEHGEPVLVEAPAEYDDITDDLEMLGEDLLSGDLFGLGDLGFGGPGGSSANADVTADTAEFEITIGSSAEGTLDGGNNEDTYRFEGTAGQTVGIALRSSDINTLDTLLELYSADSVLLTENDDAPGSAPSEYELQIYDSYLTYTLPEDGTYVIVAASLFSMSGSADYTLFLEAVE